MSKKTKLIFQSILIIVKNATIIIPILEGIVDAIYAVRHPEPVKSVEAYVLNDDIGSDDIESVKKGE